jgi:hypothetical protein
MSAVGIVWPSAPNGTFKNDRLLKQITLVYKGVAFFFPLADPLVDNKTID